MYISFIQSRAEISAAAIVIFDANKDSSVDVSSNDSISVNSVAKKQKLQKFLLNLNKSVSLIMFHLQNTAEHDENCRCSATLFVALCENWIINWDPSRHQMHSFLAAVSCSLPSLSTAITLTFWVITIHARFLLLWLLLLLLSPPIFAY